MNVIVLTDSEEFIQYLDTDYLQVEETHEKYGLRTIEVKYTIDNVDLAKKLFKLGNKIFITNDPNVKDCLFVINDSVKEDYFKDNQVVFNAEEVLTELNYVTPYNQTDVTAAKGFTISTINNEQNVTVNRFALEYWFGDYFEIGIVQKCLNDRLSKIVPVGTMTKMQLLRFIEEETSNVFVTRYEKDAKTNVIRRYLDFLNPESSSSSWELKIKYDVPQEEEDSVPEEDLPDGVDEDDEPVVFPPFIPPSPLDVEECILRLVDGDGTVIEDEDGEGIALCLEDIGVTNDDEEYEIFLNYALKVVNEEKKPTLTVKVNAKSIDYSLEPTAEETTAEVMGTYDSYDSVAQTNPDIYVALPDNCRLELYDNLNEEVIFYTNVNPVLGVVHEDIIDLTYSTEDISYEVDEGDCFTAIAPIIGSNNSTGSDGLSRSQISTVINRWKNLAVTKGQVIPMIIERKQESTPRSGTPVVSSNYWSNPLKTNAGSGQYEYWVATAYWQAPFTKKAGELFVTTPENTGAGYTHIRGKPDDERGINVPKIGPVETSDEDPYAIYNDVANKLKTKMYPKFELSVDVHNYQQGRMNNYQVWDKVMCKVPGFEKLILARVSETKKNPFDIGENTVKLDNYNFNNNKGVQIATSLSGSNVNLTYPAKGKLPITLYDENMNPISNKLITFSLYQVKDNQTNFQKSYNVKTNQNGVATLQLNLQPSKWEVVASFGGDVIYGESNITVNVNVGGTLQKATTTKKSNVKATAKPTTTKQTVTETVYKNQTKKVYYDKYGRSPDGKVVASIGLPSRASSLRRYGYTYWKTIFVNWCPVCKEYHTLYWGWNYGAYFRGRREGGSAEGHIFCDHCDSDFDAINGENHNDSGYPKLKMSKSPVRSSRNEAQALKNGKVLYKTETVKVPVKVTKTISRTQKVSSISNTIKKAALNIVGNSTGIEAAKKIAIWVAKNIKNESRTDFYQTPDTTYKRKKGNDCCQTELMLQMMDVAGVCSVCTVKYIHVKKNNTGHVFAKVNGIYVDPCMSSTPWGHYLTQYGALGSGKQPVYPTKPW